MREGSALSRAGKLILRKRGPTHCGPCRGLGMLWCRWLSRLAVSGASLRMPISRVPPPTVCTRLSICASRRGSHRQHSCMLRQVQSSGLPSRQLQLCIHVAPGSSSGVITWALTSTSSSKALQSLLLSEWRTERFFWASALLGCAAALALREPPVVVLPAMRSCQWFSSASPSVM